MKKAIYKITNKCNGKVYIGQSIDPNKRFNSHKSRANNGSNMLIHQDMRNFGIENFCMDVLEWTDFPDQREQELIKEFNSINPNGYNELIGGINELPHKYGELHHNSVISDENVNIVKDLLKHSNLTQSEICQKVVPNINQVMVNSINMGHTHYDPSETYPLRVKSPYHLTENDVNEIKWLLLNSQCTVYEIADHYNVSSSTIKHINAGRNYYDNSLIYPLRKRTYGKKDIQPVETILAKRSTTTIDT